MMRCAVTVAALGLAWGCTAAGSGEPSGPAPVAVRDDALVTVTLDGKPVLTYRHGDAPFKPYVKTLCTPGGVQILRDSPHDHVHHRGLMFALAVDGMDFWSEAGTSGKQVPAAAAGTTAIPGGGVRIDQRLNWIPAGSDKPTAVEDRSVAVHGVVQGATLLTWRTTIRPAPGVDGVSLSGSHYQGLGMRFVTSMDGADTFLHASGAVGPLVRGTEHVTPSAWSACTAPADGKPVTAALLDHPKNPRAPAGMFTMYKPFSYLAATPNVWKQPLVLKAGETLDLRYGVAVLDGETGRERLASIHQAWIGLAGG